VPAQIISASTPLRINEIIPLRNLPLTVIPGAGRLRDGNLSIRAFSRRGLQSNPPKHLDPERQIPTRWVSYSLG